MTTSLFNIYQQLTSCRLTSTDNLSGVYSNGILGNGIGSTLTFNSNFSEIDSIQFELNDRILLTNQINGNENGIYIVSQLSNSLLDISCVLTRSNDFQSIEQMQDGQFLSISDGDQNKGSIFVLVNPLPQYIGVPGNNINFTNSVQSGGDIYLKIANNLSDVADEQDSRENLGFGDGSLLTLTDSSFTANKYLITSPSPAIINVSVTSPGNTIVLPDLSQNKSLYPGSTIRIDNDINSQNIEIDDFSFNLLSTLIPGSNLLFTLVDNSTDNGLWDISSISGVVRSWDGSTSSVDVTAGTGIDITDGVISLTGTGASAGYGYLTRQNISFSSISFVDSTNYFIPLIGNVTPDINQCNNFTPFLDGNSHLGIQYTGSEAGVAEITFQLGIAYSSSNTNTNPNNYMLSANLNLTAGPSGSFAPINIISSNNSGSNIPFTINPGATTTVTITFQVPMNPNDVFYPNIRNNGPSNSAPLNAIVINTYSIISEKIGDIGGTSAGVASLNGLTGNLDLTSSDSTISITPSGTNIDLSIGVVEIDHGGTNSTSLNFYSNSGAQDGIVFYDSTRLKSNSEFTYDPVQGIMAINSSSANPGVTVATTFGSSNIAFISASRAAIGNGQAQYRLLTSSTNEWTWGTFAGSQDLLFTSHNGGNVLLQLEYSTNDVNIYSGNLNIITNGKTINYFYSDADKVLFLGKSNSSKISHQSGFNFSLYSGSFTSDGGGINTGIYSWYSVDSSGSAFQKIMGLSNSGILNLPQLTSNSVVVTDSSSNLSSLSQGTLGEVLTSNGPGVLPSWSVLGPAPTIYAFSAHLAGALPNSTGDGTLVNVTCDSSDFDIGSNYNVSTGLFTAPANGIYSFGCSVFLGNLSNSHTQYLMYIVAGGNTYMMSQGNPSNERSAASNQLTRRGTVLVQLTTGQTAQLQVEVDGTAKTVTIGDGGQPTSFFGNFIGSNSVTITGIGGFGNYITNTSTSVSIALGTLYYNNSSTLATYTLPTATGSNKGCGITGLNTAGGGWTASLQVGDSIQLDNTVGTSNISSTVNSDSVFIIDAAPNLWVIFDVLGNINIS